MTSAPHLTVLSSQDPTHVAATCEQHDLSIDEFRDLQRQSTTAAQSAYCPYSHFPVGAAVLTRYGIDTSGTGAQTSSGRIILGANVENAAYPVGTCAERVALGRAVFEGHRDFKAIAVLAPTAPAETPCSPCGMCRQFIREFCELKMPIIMFSKNGHYIAVKLEGLLPLSFGPEALAPAAVS
ncbi:cytidine deaminase [Grosmannia clavigera kw1407]|uniref:Cytidine deaminase n=1 Tax=Grosmannia clavigera (strain kw1407 / UAMH 11150) TaxID=655863 RepID=F0XHE6_GROCL|nr:cytidine deaminase [Grosmannia clavigera kw1407]EFX02867.1 cytidine deaminase [Grosmannia clavigera kw1407]